MMKSLLWIVTAVSLFVCSCRKEQDGRGRNERTVTLSFVNEDGQAEVLEEIVGTQDQEGPTMYKFGGVAGNYFGLISRFRLGNGEQMEIILGTLRTKNSWLTLEDFLDIIAPGNREFGSLGSFSSYPWLKPGCVEINYTDAKGRRWCSTGITEKQTPFGLEAVITLPARAASSFRIDRVGMLEVSETRIRYEVEGNYDCFLFEVNGKGKKRIRGGFVAEFAASAE